VEVLTTNSQTIVERIQDLSSKLISIHNRKATEKTAQILLDFSLDERSTEIAIMRIFHQEALGKYVGKEIFDP
jgi:predicted restriction endonuclease